MCDDITVRSHPVPASGVNLAGDASDVKLSIGSCEPQRTDSAQVLTLCKSVLLLLIRDYMLEIYFFYLLYYIKMF